MTGVFLDTNILVYAFGPEAKARTAKALLDAPFVIGVQTLNEYGLAARRKLGMSWPAVENSVGAILELAEGRVIDTILDDVRYSLHLAGRHNLALFDALMLAIALRAGCTTFYSEDLQHGFRVEDRMTVFNPFA